MYTIFLRRGKAESLKRFHPWVFSGAIAGMNGRPEEGNLVRVVSHENELMGYGHYQIGSIAVRMLTFDDIPIDQNFWYTRLAEAFRLRRALQLTGREDNNIYRLVHGEGDRLPGLVIDVYGRTAVLQAHSVGMHHERHHIAGLLLTVQKALLRTYIIRVRPPYPSRPS